MGTRRISRVGEGVRERRPGEAVVLYAAGCMESYAIAPQARALPLPAGLSFIEGATLPAVFVTAYCALVKHAQLRRGETVLIHAATGGVGLAAVQIARHLGAEVLTTAGSARKRAFLENIDELGFFTCSTGRKRLPTGLRVPRCSLSWSFSPTMSVAPSSPATVTGCATPIQRSRTAKSC